MKKITYIISKTNKSLALEWTATFLDKTKFELSFILLNESGSTIENFLLENKFQVHRVTYKNKSNLLSAIRSTFKLLKKIKPDIVHAHFFEANIIGMMAARMAGVKKRIYTRHHSRYHHDYFPAAVKYDKFCNRVATDIVAISKVVSSVLEKENVPASKIHLVPHGFRMDEFLSVSPERTERLRSLYNPKAQRPVIGIISRYTHLKGIQYVIPAFKRLLTLHPDALLLLANAKGHYKSDLALLLKEIPPRNYIEIAFEEDIAALYRLFDVFVHVPITAQAEAFGYIYVEALVSKVPSVFTLSGIAHDFVEHNRNALVVGYKNSEEIYNGIVKLLTDKEFVERITTTGKADVLERFDLGHMIRGLEKIYLE